MLAVEDDERGLVDEEDDGLVLAVFVEVEPGEIVELVLFSVELERSLEVVVPAVFVLAMPGEV